MFETRINSIKESLAEHEIDALLITSTYNIAYLSGIHAFSVEEREARIIVTKNNAYLFTDARYTEMVEKHVPFIILCEINAKNTFSKQTEEIFKKESIKHLGFEEESITYKEVSDLEEKLKSIEFIPTVEIIEKVRVSKDKEEVERTKRACGLTDKAFVYIQTLLKPGVTETEIKANLENFIRLNGGDLAFSSIVAFGANSSIPHHMSTASAKLRSTDIILLDFGAKVNGYCSDMTRTIFIGKPSDDLMNIYTAVKEAQEVAIDYIKTHKTDGFELKKAHELANSHLGKLGFSDIPHSLGHGVGLQVHESPMVSPYSDEKLIPGMIITVEPGVYKTGLGGVRIEDTCLVTENGLDILTASKKDLTII